jgi:predicted ATPase
MITRVEALNYRSLRYINRPVNGINVLVGPNASGKTTFIDVIAFLGDLVRSGFAHAVESRTRNWTDLLWMRQGSGFQLALEARIPAEIRAKLGEGHKYQFARFEVGISGIGPEKQPGITHEILSLRAEETSPDHHRMPTLFPENRTPPDDLWAKTQRNKRNIVSKAAGGNDNFNTETSSEGGKGWLPSFKFGPFKSALANLPADESKFPVAVWFRELLTSGIQQMILNSQLIRQASPPSRQMGFLPDGSNLPWVINRLQVASSDRFAEWIHHVQTALPELRSIRTIERPDDKHRYLIVDYGGIGEVPSWMVSDGTLRLLALTLTAYLPEFTGLYLIEEPENGIHPRAIETVFQSLSSVQSAQVLTATHSPVILSMAEPKSMLCFAKTNDGATDIVSGIEHPRLQEWRGENNLSTLFAAGVLDHS